MKITKNKYYRINFEYGGRHYSLQECGELFEEYVYLSCKEDKNFHYTLGLGSLYNKHYIPHMKHGQTYKHTDLSGIYKIIETYIDKEVKYDDKHKHGGKNMDKIAKNLVESYIEEHLDKSDVAPEYHVFTVWKCKTLQNFKYLISSTLHDGMYYELTYNGDKKEWYLDAYKKFENRCIKTDDIIVS